MLNERKLINYFVLGQMADIFVTKIALDQLQGFREVGVLGSELIEQQETRLLIIKIAITALMVGGFALSRNKNRMMEFVTRRSMEISTGILYLILTANASQILFYVLDQFSQT